MTTYSYNGKSAIRLVILESPYAGDVKANEAYARRAMKDCLLRGEAPYASHLLYTQEGVLDDTVPAEREFGIDAGLAWGDKADATVVYFDRGISSGMRYGIERARRANRPVEFRLLDLHEPRRLAELWDEAIIAANIAADALPLTA